jgi:hypothetical protein
MHDVVEYMQSYNFEKVKKWEKIKNFLGRGILLMMFIIIPDNKDAIYTLYSLISIK